MPGNNRISLLTLLLIISLEFYAGFFYYPKWKLPDTEATISWDASGYYMYLPAIFIYHDLKKCSFQDQVLNKYHPTPNFQQAFLHSSGNYVMKYACGQGIILSPAFFSAHAFCKLTHSYPADGFSLPYQFSVWLWCIILSALGLFVLRKILLLYFNDISVALTLFSIGLCSNYFEYASISGAMSHNTLFTVYALLVYFVIRFYQRPTLLFALVIGAVCGLCTITRPTEIVCLIIPLVWGIGDRQGLSKRLTLFQTKFKLFGAAALTFCSVAFIQLFYWKWVSGQWIVYSYQDQGFDWFHPHIYKCLFSVKAGWLLYSPVMCFAIIGLAALYKIRRNLFFICFLFLSLFTYSCFSWSEWWYGFSLGQRAMIQSYPLWAFSLCAFYQFIVSKGTLYKVVISFILLWCFLYNAWLVHQCHIGGLFKGPEMTRAYYLATLGRLQVDERVFTLLDNKDLFRENPPNPSIVYSNNFDTDASANAFVSDSTTNNTVLRLDKDLQFSKKYAFPFKKDKAKWLRASAVFRSREKEWNTWKMGQFILKFMNGDKEVQSNMIRVYRLLNDNSTKRISLDARIPDEAFQTVSIEFYHAESEKVLLIDSLEVITF